MKCTRGPDVSHVLDPPNGSNTMWVFAVAGPHHAHHTTPVLCALQRSWPCCHVQRCWSRTVIPPRSRQETVCLKLEVQRKDTAMRCVLQGLRLASEGINQPRYTMSHVTSLSNIALIGTVSAVVLFSSLLVATPKYLSYLISTELLLFWSQQ